MTLSEADYKQLEPHIPIIKHVSNGGNTSKSDAWYAMNTVNVNRTGFALKAGCTACMVQDYQRYWNMIQGYEAQ